MSTNSPIAQFNMHEVDVVEAVDPASGMRRWVAAMNNLSESLPSSGFVSSNQDYLGQVAWAYSTDITASSWIASLGNPPSGTFPFAGWEETNWIPPGTPSDGQPFLGWHGDPSLAAIGNPPDGTKLILTNVVSSNADPNKGVDVAMLVSTTGGKTFGTPTYVSQPTGGRDVDQPQVVSNTKWPYSTFVSWTNGTNIPGQRTGWFTSINNTTLQPGSSQWFPSTWSTGQAKPIQGILYNNAYHPKMAVSSVQWCDGSTHELVWFVWHNNFFGKVCSYFDPNTHTTKQTTGVAWTAAIFDNTTGIWESTNLPVDSDANWPLCVTANPTVTHVVNNAEAYLTATQDASDPTLSNAAMIHDRSTSGPAAGARERVDYWTAKCVNGHLLSAPAGFFLGPTPCYTFGGWCPEGQIGGNGGGGTTTQNDQFGGRIAFQYSSGNPYVFVTWYDTSFDPTNTFVSVRGALNTGGFGHDPFYSGPNTPSIYSMSIAQPGQSIPWDYSNPNTNYWWDYQAIGTTNPAFDTTNHLFLSAWGGDNRLLGTGGPSGMWSALVAP